MSRTDRNGRTAAMKRKKGSLRTRTISPPRVYRLHQPGEHRAKTRAYTTATNGYEVRRMTFDTVELLQCILIHLPVKQLYSVQRVSEQFRQAILGCPLIRNKMLLNRSTNVLEKWRIVEGGHEGTEFQSVGHWLFLHKPDPAGPMFQPLSPSDAPSLPTFTPAVLHPVFLNGPWDPEARKEALRSAPPAWLNGPQRWVPAVTLQAITMQDTVGSKNVLLGAYTSNPRCLEAVVRSVGGLKLSDVYKSLDEISDALHSKVAPGERQNLIRREIRTFMPCDIHPVTTQEWEVVRSLRAGL